MSDPGRPLPPQPEVRELSELVAGQLADDEEVADFSAGPATSVGENYGSTMLALDITIRKKGGQAGDRHLHAICKMLPTDAERRVVFCVDVTFIKELQMYTLAVPAMARLQRDCGVPDRDLVSHLVPRCYGGRTGLTGEEVDDDAAILLEDMRRRGFATGDRHSGVDRAHARLVAEKIAVLHALPVALRAQRPREYEDTVLRACKHFLMSGGKPADGDDDAKKKSMEDLDGFAGGILTHVTKSPEASRYRDAIERIIKETGVGPTEKVPPAREPFASITHSDLWTNNMLFRSDEDGRPQDVAFIDFQVTRLNSPLKDLIFFLFTSAHLDVTGDHLDEIVEAYHASFCRCLEQVGVDTTPFSLVAVWAEMDAVAATELFHILSMLRVILADPAMVRDNPETFIFMEELGGPRCTARVEHTVLQFAKRGWITA